VNGSEAVIIPEASTGTKQATALQLRVRRVPAQTGVRRSEKAPRLHKNGVTQNGVTPSCLDLTNHEDPAPARTEAGDGRLTELNDRLVHFRAGTSNRDEAVALCGEQFHIPQGVGMPGDSAECFAEIQSLWRLGPMTLAKVGSGCDGWVICGEQRTTYDVKVPQAGHLESIHRGSPAIVRPGAAAILLPDSGATLRLGQGAQIVCVNIDRCAVDDALSDSLGRETLSQIEFTTTISTTKDEARAWTNLLAVLVEHIFKPDSLLNHPLVTMPMVDSLVRGLLLAVEHPQRDALTARAAALPAPKVVRTAIEIMEAEPHLPWTISSLAARSYTSVRSLQTGFQRYMGVSPMAYLRQVRLRRAHQDLLSCDPSTETVTSVALRWGFNNLSRFGALHKARYRENPGVTLRRTARST
jgi:AraC-like DNA-binding protein